jgi:hypothetical protein
MIMKCICLYETFGCIVPVESVPLVVLCIYTHIKNVIMIMKFICVLYGVEKDIAQ